MLLAAYFLAGGIGGITGSGLTTTAVQQLSERVESIVEDPDRSEMARQTLEELKKEVQAFEKIFARSGRQLTRSYRNQTADREQYFAVLDDLNASWEASQQHTLDLRFELKNSLTESEWVALFVDK